MINKVFLLEVGIEPALWIFRWCWPPFRSCWPPCRFWSQKDM